MENSLSHIKLINGVFKPGEAADVLISVINDKIKFHTVQSLNLQAGHATSNLDSEQRISQLKEAKELVMSIVVDAHRNDYEISIDSDLIIKLTKPKPKP